MNKQPKFKLGWFDHIVLGMLTITFLNMLISVERSLDTYYLLLEVILGIIALTAIKVAGLKEQRIDYFFLGWILTALPIFLKGDFRTPEPLAARSVTLVLMLTLSFFGKWLRGLNWRIMVGEKSSEDTDVM